MLGKNFYIRDYICYASSVISEIKLSTLNACWKNPWPECVTNAVPTDSANYSEIINLAHAMDGEPFSDMTREDVDEILWTSY